MTNLDAFILTSVSRFPDSQPAYMVGKFLREVTETLRKGGNVLVPCTPTGIIYDLFEVVLQEMENARLAFWH